MEPSTGSSTEQPVAVRLLMLEVSIRTSTTVSLFWWHVTLQPLTQPFAKGIYDIKTTTGNALLAALRLDLFDLFSCKHIKVGF